MPGSPENEATPRRGECRSHGRKERQQKLQGDPCREQNLSRASDHRDSELPSNGPRLSCSALVKDHIPLRALAASSAC